MGAYLSEPNVEKISDDGSCEELSYGASAMQGWRVGMEDSHNCITKLTEDTSLFAVYDGHGGAEVAVYTAQQFPKLLTNLKSFKDGDIDAAFEEAFMTFDASLKQKAIIEKLRRIAGMEEGEEKEEDGETETLLEEAELPLEQLVARYCSQPSKNKRAMIKQAHGADLLSPMIQKKQPRFPLTAVNGSLQDGDGPVPNKTVPFDEEGDIVAKGKRDEDENVDSVNGPDGDKRREGENGTDSDDDDVDEEGGEVKVKKEVAEIGKGDGAPEKREGSVKTQVKDEAGTSANSGSHNGNVQHSDTKESGSSTSGTSSESKLKQIVPPYLDDDDDDSDEEDEDYRSGDEEEEEEEDEEDDDEEEEEEDFDGEDEEELGEGEDSGDFEEEEEEDYRMQLPGGKEEPGSDSGSTAVVALLRGKTLTVANIGDSRCVLSRNGVAFDMSYDHKPEDDIELRRIEKAGGKVTPDGRVNGGLNLSRAFGDHCYKMTTSLPPEEQMISAFPDIKTATLTEQDDFMVVACDGIWNAMTSQDVIDFVTHRLENSRESDQSNKLSKICEELFDFCLSPDTSGDGTGCDNMTCVIVQFHSNGADSISGASGVSGKRKSAEDKPEETDSKKPRH